MDKKIYYHDTDSGGVVYYANYLKYFEEARTEYLYNKGIDIKELSEKGSLFVVRRAEIDYKSPARYGDRLIISTDISKIRSASLVFCQQAKRGEQLLVCAKTQLVCVDGNFSPKAFPQEILKYF